MKVHHTDEKATHGPIGGAKLPHNRKKVRGKGPPHDGLTLIWEWFGAHRRSLAGAPPTLLKQAEEHITSRIETLDGMKQDGRVRIQLKWLRSWLTAVAGSQ